MSSDGDKSHKDEDGVNSNSHSSSRLLPSDHFENVIELYGASRSTCGYCDNRSAVKGGATLHKGRKTYDFKALKLTASVYQELIDRGWRRSGQFCYFPYNEDTCCPNYSIACSATKLELSRTQRRCIEKMHSFLVHDSTRKKVKLSDHVIDSNWPKKETPWKHDINYIKNNFDKLKQSSKAKDRRFVASCERIMRTNGVSLVEAVQTIRNKARNTSKELDLTLEDHLYPKRTNLKTTSSLNGLQPKHKLEIRLVHVDSAERKAFREKEHEVIVKYQEVVHKEPEDEWTMSRFENFLVDSPLKTEPMLDRDYFEPDTGGDSEHRGPLSVDLFSSQSGQFALVKPPPLPTHFGTYHCIYLLDDELIAVGVMDFLPKCLTTVYFFYNPKYANLNLGIYSALIEISIVRQLYKHHKGASESNQLKHYYMGFYVHQSKKMHYKTTFKPSYLLCPFTGHYVPVERVLPMLEKHKFARFDPDNEPPSGKLTISNIVQIPASAPVLHDSTNISDYFMWLRINTSSQDVQLLIDRFLVQYAEAIGLKSNLLLRLLVKLDAIHKALVDRHRSRAS